MHGDLKDGGLGQVPLVPHFTFTGRMQTSMDPALLTEIFRLRYEVYCLECQVLNPSDYQQGCETDRFDAHAFHIAAHNLGDLLVGSVRLVLAEKNEEFPFQKYCPIFNNITLPSVGKCVEISRLIVHADYRRRVGYLFQGMKGNLQEEGDGGDAVQTISNIRPGEKERRSNNPRILLGMYREIYRFSCNNGIRFWFTAMKSSLARVLSSFGVRFTPIGPQALSYNRVMMPYMASLDELENDMLKANPRLAQWFMEE
jgi:N-acyl amino acid synthase of PEP-CTERM/exosortase system